MVEEILFKSRGTICVSAPSSYRMLGSSMVESMVKVATLHGFMKETAKSKLTFDGVFVGPNALTVTV